jgi:hypothetical protein
MKTSFFQRGVCSGCIKPYNGHQVKKKDGDQRCALIQAEWENTILLFFPERAEG